jgi:nitrite reductase (NADH) small subunit
VPEYMFACEASAVKPGKGLTVDCKGLSIAILNDAGTYRAMTDRCPHAGGSLGKGWIDDGEVVCPLHRWRFRLDSGRCTTERGNTLRRFPCELRDGKIWIAV